MKLVLPSSFLLLISMAASTTAWIPTSTTAVNTRTSNALFGYLDNISEMSKGIYDDEEEEEDDSREATRLDKAKVANYGVGDWSGFRDFQEFDGGDGQMGVAGDGKQGLEKEWSKSLEMAKSKTVSAKVAWGKTTGYADELRERGVETSRAQQLENWMNQQEVLAARKQHRYMTDEFDQVSKDENWRSLGNFGTERNQDFDLDKAFGDVVPGENLEGTIELTSRINQPKIYDISLLNSFMGFSDFRARFTAETSKDWTITPTEGSISGRTPTEFVLKFRPTNPGKSEGYLVIDTEEAKWTYKLIGTSSM